MEIAVVIISLVSLAEWLWIAFMRGELSYARALEKDQSSRLKEAIEEKAEMESLSAMMMGERNRDKPMMVFDWDRAAQLILEHGASEASAGLRSDWEYTGGSIFANGAPVSKSIHIHFWHRRGQLPSLRLMASVWRASRCKPTPRNGMHTPTGLSRQKKSWLRRPQTDPKTDRRRGQ